MAAGSRGGQEHSGRRKIPDVTAGYTYAPQNIFNMYESGLFYRTTTKTTLSVQGEQCAGGKQAKDRHVNVRSLPVTYRNNKTAWMTSDLFLEWLQTLDRKMHQQYRNILQFADNAPSHPDIDLENDMASAGMEHRVVQCCCLATLSEENKVPGNESLPPDLINLSVKLARVSVDGYTCAVGVTAILPELFWDLSREHMEDNNIGKGQMVQACHQKAVDKRQLCFLHPDSDVGEHHKKHGKDEKGRSKKTSVLLILGMDELILEWLKQYGVKMESEHISRKVAAEMLSGFKVEAENLPFSVKGDEASTVKLTASCHFQEYLQEDLVRLLWWPSQTAPVCKQTPRPDFYFAQRLLLWMPRRLWLAKLFCPRDGCNQVELISARIYLHVRQAP
ncbi:TIGD4 [Branchiostoma lanceolatum]|uniref:TIGD4 protein n=1 Tax=Branchiostoma lanceolatum TaxID=7740 RepID=A0A8J9YVM0_BRALA|nr:TIGD4 [Branchiostoma lanceolatum]